MNLPQAISASLLRWILLATIILIVLAGASVFYFAYTQLEKTASETGERVATARESEDTLQRLQSLQAELESKREIINTTSSVMADSQNFAYQDRIINDLTIYASRANLSIKNISFAAAPATTATAPVTTDGSPPPAAAAGMKKATVDITLESPINYQNLLNFLHYVEQNLTKLKVNRVVMTKSDGDNVSIDILNLEVYIR